MKTELLQWNYDVGNGLEESLVSAWENATTAARRYGDFVSAMDMLKSADSGSSIGSYDITTECLDVLGERIYGIVGVVDFKG